MPTQYLIPTTLTLNLKEFSPKFPKLSNVLNTTTTKSNSSSFAQNMSYSTHQPQINESHAVSVNDVTDTSLLSLSGNLNNSVVDHPNSTSFYRHHKTDVNQRNGHRLSVVNLNGSTSSLNKTNGSRQQTTKGKSSRESKEEQKTRLETDLKVQYNTLFKKLSKEKSTSRIQYGTGENINPTPFHRSKTYVNLTH